MLKISEHTMHQFGVDQAEQLGRRLLAAMPALGTIDVANDYVAQALDAALETDQDIAEFTSLLFPVDRHGRPPHIDEVVRDDRTEPALKLFQIRYALYGEAAQ